MKNKCWNSANTDRKEICFCLSAISSDIVSTDGINKKAIFDGKRSHLELIRSFITGAQIKTMQWIMTFWKGSAAISHIIKKLTYSCNYFLFETVVFFFSQLSRVTDKSINYAKSEQELCTEIKGKKYKTTGWQGGERETLLLCCERSREPRNPWKPPQ